MLVLTMHDNADTRHLNEKLRCARQAFESADFQQAFRLFTELTQLAPENGEICFYFGATLLAIEEFDSAIAKLSQACQTLPGQIAPLFKLADAFEAVNSISDVETVINFSLTQFPKHPEVLYRAANFYQEVGQLSKADELASVCVSHSKDMLLNSYAWLLRLNIGKMPNLNEAHSALLSIKKATINKVINKVTPEKSTDNTRLIMIVNFALGRYYDLVKNSSQAFAHWKKANALQLSMCDYKVKDLKPLFDAIQANTYLLPEKLTQNLKQNLKQRGYQSTSFTPIFILGLPRTGSTLLEQILCRHTDVTSLGEQALIGGHIANFIGHHTQQDYPLYMPELTSEAGQILCQQAAKQYEKALKRRQLNSAFVIDKLPANFQSIGLILALFPNAKIIHLNRNLADTALSIFKNHFAVNEPYMSDLQELSDYLGLHKGLMQHWHQIYPGKIVELSYERLVAQPHSTIAEVLTYCGLSQQPACLQMSDQNAAQRMVKTLSSAQVTEPIHTRSVGRHSDYAALLRSHGFSFN